MDMILKVKLFLTEHIDTNFPSKKYLLGISGGVDSMVLFDVFSKLNLRFSVAHLNYQLRGNDSNIDEAFVIDYCKKYKTPFYTKKIDMLKDKPTQQSIQMYARDIRYQFFEKLKKDLHFDYIVTAHHFNDSLETFIINLTRGTGLKGLLGVPKYTENKIIRPLTDFPKKEIFNYAKQYSLLWREDISNEKQDYLRNKIRHKVIPLLEEISNNNLNNYKKSIEILNDTNEFLEKIITKKKEKIIKKSKNIFQINKLKLLKKNRIVIRNILSEFGFSNTEEIQKILHSKVGSIFFSSKYRLLTDRENFFITNLEKNKFENTLIKNDDFLLKNPIKIKGKKSIEIDNEATYILDYDKLDYPLIIKEKKEGDYFYPLGMVQKKKLSKFLKDEKINRFNKENIWVLCDANNNIICVSNIKLDNRFKITNQTKNFLNIFLDK